jgi:hypothetical protein
MDNFDTEDTGALAEASEAGAASNGKPSAADMAGALAMGARPLSEAHQRTLRERAIAEAVWLERGTLTYEDGLVLTALGLAPAPSPGMLILIHPTSAQPGDAPIYVMRPDQPADPKVKYFWPAGEPMRLDCPPRCHAQLRNPSEPIHVCEGWFKADALAAAGLTAVAMIGTWCWGAHPEPGMPILGDWEVVVLASRLVRICFDSDVRSNPDVAKARAELTAFLRARGAIVEWVDLPAAADGAKLGVDDWLALGHTADELASLATPAPEPRGNATTQQPSQADRLVALVEDAAALFHDGGGRPYAELPAGDHYETWALGSRGFKDWLAREYYHQQGRTPSSTGLADAITVLTGKARFDNTEIPVFMRLGAQEGRIYLDLGNERWEAVEIDAEGWRVLARPPVRFRRSKGMLALPTPVAGGRLSDLRRFLNAEDAAWVLVTSWLLATLRPSGPYPVLVLNGEHGSAKSSQARILRSLVDPSEAPLRSFPRTERDLAIAANNSWVLALDNLSKLVDWQSDSMCRLATGGGLATRALYTDDEEAIFDAQRPQIITSIEEVATRADLLDRSLLAQLPTIPPLLRREESALWAEFAEARPGILGAALDAVSEGLRKEADTRLAELPRMADFAKWIVAAEPALPWEAGAFLATYTKNRQEATALTLEASLVGQLVVTFAHGQPKPWTGTAGDLLAELTTLAGDKLAKKREWPSNPKLLSDALRRLASTLRVVGVDVEFHPRGKRGRLLTISAQTGTTEPRPPDGGPKGDAGETQGDAGQRSGEGSASHAEDEKPTQRREKQSNGDAGDAGDAEKPLFLPGGGKGGEADKDGQKQPGTLRQKHAKAASPTSPASLPATPAEPAAAEISGAAPRGRGLAGMVSHETPEDSFPKWEALVGEFLPPAANQPAEADHDDLPPPSPNIAVPDCCWQPDICRASEPCWAFRTRGQCNAATGARLLAAEQDAREEG